MEQLDQIAAQFYAIPFVEMIFNSHGILRLAALQYGTPLFLVLCALVTLIIILLIAKLKPKKGRPKKVRQRKEKPAKAEKTPRASRRSKSASPAPKKARGTPKSVLKNLAKIPETTLPLYPVADKRKPLAIDDGLNNDMAFIAPVVDDSSLIAGLDSPDQMMPQAQPVASAPVQSFTLDNMKAAEIMADAAPSVQIDDEFDIPAIDIDPGANLDMNANTDFGSVGEFGHDSESIEEEDNDAFDMPSSNDHFGVPETEDHFDAEEDDMMLSEDDDGYEEDGYEDDVHDDEDFAPSMDMDSPKHEVTVDVSPIGGDDFEMPVGSFGSDGDASADGLSEEARQKLAELNDQGVT